MLKLYHVLLACAGSLAIYGSASAQLQIVLHPDAALSANPAALASFQRAADSWSIHFSDPITVNINASLANLGNPNIIGSTSSTLVVGSYTTIRNAMVADGAAAPNGAILNSLPTAAQFTAFIPAGSSLTGNIVLTQANANALGFNVNFGADASMTFNSVFNFDYDRSNGISPGATDFETVAAHEIGHALGFISVVDDADVGVTSLSMRPLDLFRFQNNVSGRDPSTAAEFTTFPRYFVPGSDAITDDIANEFRMSTGVNLGDGSQASHWKADELTGILIGVMDPTLASDTFETISSADLRAMDLIGYNLIAVPEPSTIALSVGAILAAAYGWRRHKSNIQKQAEQKIVA